MDSERTKAMPRKKCLALWAISLAGAVALAFEVTQTIASADVPPLLSVGACAAFVVWSGNLPANLTADIDISPSLMVVMVAVAAFSGHGGVLAAAIVGLSGGLIREVLSNPTRSLGGNLLMTSFNCAQLLLAASAAAIVYARLADPGVVGTVTAGVCATVAYTTTNFTLNLTMSVAGGVPARQVFLDCAPILPNFFAFGIVGALVGQLYSDLGLLSLVLLVVPSMIGRIVYRSSVALQQARDDTISVFMKALEAKDLYTARHTHRVAKYSAYIGEALGLRGARLSHLSQAALMHDIGKMAVSSQLLNKPGRLTEDEYADIRRHNEVCVGILTQVEFLRSTIPVAQDRHGFFHDEADRRQPEVLEGFIVAVADAFDAMTSTRAYRKALTQEVAFAELRKGKGTQFDPDSVEALISAIELRGETFGAGYETELVTFEVEPPVAGVGSAGLGDLDRRFDLRQPVESLRHGSVYPFRAE